MSKQWNELKATITDLRDNYGIGTQREVCGFLVRLMNKLEKQMNGSEEPNKWIPTSERLPEKNVEVLATTEWGAITIAERCSENEWFIYEGDTTANADEIKAWCELPEPYKLESEDKE